MGNREDLLAGALQCLKEKGWANTTVRDIATAAGVSHAAIGYHYGSREALLTQAFIKAMDEWGDEVGRTMRAAMVPNATPGEQYVAMWREMINSFTRSRPLWVASIEAFVQSEHSPELQDVRGLLAGAQREGRRGLAAGLLGVAENELDEATERSVGAVQSALVSGVLMQWLLDAESAPSAQDVAAGLRAIGAILTEEQSERPSAVDAPA